MYFLKCLFFLSFYGIKILYDHIMITKFGVTMLSYEKGNIQKKMSSNYVLFDLETTGFSPINDAIIEISAIKVRDNKVISEFSHLINPQRPIPYRITEITHIYDHMVGDKPTISEILPKFIEFIGDDILVGHNIHRFDMNFLYQNCNTCFGKIPDNDYIDTLVLARNVLPNYSKYTLTFLAEAFDIITEGAHRALNDCHINHKVYQKLVKIVNNSI